MLLVSAAVFALLAVFVFWTAGGAFRKRRYMGAGARTISGLLFLTLSALAATLIVATKGYLALTREVVAAHIVTTPTGPQRFDARVTFPDGTDTTYALAGDQMYVDAHILKWEPFVNILGLHTAYELDRIGGRYMQLAHEQDSVRTVFSLKTDKPVDMFDLRTRFAFLAPFLDAEYGSGTFIAADQAASYEVRVSTSGLLIRPAVSVP